MGLLKAIALWEWSQLRVRAGSDVLVDLYDERFADTAWQRREFVPGVFAEAEYRPQPELLLVAGLRGDWHNRVGAFLTPRAYVRWQPLPRLTFRLSAGRGMRVPNPVADNLPLFLSSRRVVFGTISPEWGWNYGGSLTLLVPVGGTWTVDIEAYRTEFRNQVVPDMDSSARLLLIRDVGHASATSVLLQLEGKLLGGELRLAYRWWDAWAQTGGQRRRRPLVSPHRVLVTTSSATADRRWQLDATLAWNSGGRLPSTADNPDGLRWAEHFPAFLRLNAQLTRRLGAWELYVGVENALNTLQRSAVIDPQNPQGPYFDASLIWGPLEGRLFYLGVRWRL
jgi:outer membrane receptor protein involved in Fe transport